MTNRIPLHTGKWVDLPRERHDPSMPSETSAVEKPVENRADRRRRTRARRKRRDG